jgi:hypothetical protein
VKPYELIAGTVIARVNSTSAGTSISQYAVPTRERPDLVLLGAASLRELVPVVLAVAVAMRGLR